MAGRIAKWLVPPLAAASALAVLVGACSAVNANDEEPGLILTLNPVHVVTAEEEASPLGSYLAGRYAYGEGDFSSSADYLREALKQDPDNLALSRMTLRLLLADGRLEEARPLARRLVELDSREATARLTLALEEIRSGSYAAAQAHLERISRDGVNAMLIPIIDAWARFGESGPEAAMGALDPLVATQGLKPIYDYHAALIADLAGRAEEAERHYLATVAALTGGTLRVVEALGAFYERTGRPAAARRVYMDYLDQHPETLWFEDALARLGTGRKPAPAVPDVTAGVAEALFAAAGALPDLQGGETALIYLQLALALRPELVTGRLLLGEILEMNDQLEKAVAVYRSIDPDSPAGWLARIRIATNLDALDRPEEAIAVLTPMVEERTERTDALVTLGDILRTSERYEEAVEAYDRAITRESSLEQRHWPLLYARGVALERAKLWERAEADFLKALELEPEQPFVLNYLGYSWVERGEYLERARELIERAVELRPNDGYIVDSLGWVRYREGDYAGAVKELERAVVLQPDDPVINDHLGDAYWRVGRRTEARFQWERALSLEPEEEDAAEIRQKLQPGLGADGRLLDEL